MVLKTYEPRLFKRGGVKGDQIFRKDNQINNTDIFASYSSK